METPTLVEALGAALDARAAQIRTAMPARVVTYDRPRQTADVVPTVWADGSEPPVIPSVPVVWPRAGGGYLVFPLDPTHGEETGLLICCEADLAEWRRTGEGGPPADAATHHLQNAVFIPGLVRASATLSAPSGATVLDGAGDLRLGDATATKHVGRGEDVNTAINTWASALQALLFPFVDITTINTTLAASLASALSAEVKVT